MKRFIFGACFFLHLFIIAVVNFAIIVGATNYIAHMTGYYGFGNVFVLLGVATIWCATYYAFIREIERRK